jgi:hypothetical protein
VFLGTSAELVIKKLLYSFSEKDERIMVRQATVEKPLDSPQRNSNPDLLPVIVPAL